MIGVCQSPLRAAAAACRNWPAVRGNSTSLSRGETASPVSSAAEVTSASTFASIADA